MTKQSTRPQKPFRVLLIGDYCIDEYQYGYVDRISPEAPIPVFRMANKMQLDGMAGNVANNLTKLGCCVTSHTGVPCKKTRLIDKKHGQQVVRIDDDKISSPLQFDQIKSLDHDAIVVSDYEKGYVSYELIEKLIKHFHGPIFVDTKKTHLGRLTGCYIKINELECNRAVSLNDKLIVTMGALGAVYKNGTDTYFPAKRVDVSDVTGAGDTFLAALTYQFLVTKDIHKAIEFAIKASAITVKHFGVYAPSLEEICGWMEL